MSTTVAPPRPESAGISWPAVLWILGMHLGAVLAFFPQFFTWSGVLVCVLLHWLTGGVGICLTYHRLLTHRSFAVRPKALEYLMTIIGSCASEGGAIGWVADHRKHHAYSDEPEDVHSPNRGFFWAHMSWWMTPDISAMHSTDYYKKWAPDLCRDPVHRFLDRFNVAFMFLLGIGLYFAGRAVSGNGWSWVVWGMFVRTVLVLHTTWLVNSASHIWGYKTHKTRDNSRNLWWVALLTYGEGWHNNHHAFQTSARHGLAWWEFDPTYWMIRAMSFLGLAYAIKVPKPSQLESRTLTGSEGAVVPEVLPAEAGVFVEALATDR